MDTELPLRIHGVPGGKVGKGLELLTGVPAGNAETPNTVHGLVNARLQQLVLDMVAFADTSPNETQKGEAETAVRA